MTSPYKTYKMKLTTLSPVFIGNGEELNQGQYVFDSKTMTAKILDENKFATFLIKNNLLDDYSKALLNFGKNINLKKWLEERRIPQNVPIFNKVIPCRELSIKDSKSKKSKTASSLNSIKTFIKNSDNLAYIPGSSLKGAIRTAICAYVVSQNKEKFQSEWQEIKYALSNRGNNQVFTEIVKKIEKRCFNLIKCSNNAKEDRDVFSTLIIGDSEGIPENKLYITTRLDCAIYKNSYSSMPMNLEIIESYTDVYFNLSINVGACQYFSIEKIQTALNFYAKQQMDNEIYARCSEYLFSPEEIAEDLKPNICFGGMSGYFNKNIVYSLAPTKQDAVNVLRIYFANKFKKHKHLEYDNEIAPHAIKAVNDNGDILPLGWCNLSVEKEIDVSDITD